MSFRNLNIKDFKKVFVEEIQSFNNNNDEKKIDEKDNWWVNKNSFVNYLCY